MKNLGPTIRKLRQKKWPHANMKDFAKRLGVTSVTMSKIEKGHQPPSIPFLEKIAGELGCPVSHIILIAEADEKELIENL